MALSMDEQRMLAEIERRLAAEDPGLAVRLSSFRRPGPAVKFRTTRSRILGSLFAVALLAVVSLMVYAMIPFRAHNAKTTLAPQASSRASVSAPAQPRPPASAAPKASASAKSGTPAKTVTAARSSAAKTATTAKTTAARTRAAARAAGPGTSAARG